MSSLIPDLPVGKGPDEALLVLLIQLFIPEVVIADDQMQAPPQLIQDLCGLLRLSIGEVPQNVNLVPGPHLGIPLANHMCMHFLKVGKAPVIHRPQEGLMKEMTVCDV